MRRIIPSLYFMLIASCLSAQTSEGRFLFKNHRDGYNVFRIPAVIITKSGKILAFCEGRRSLLDNGDIDLVMKTSIDNGITWSGLKVIWNEGKNTCGNPSPVYDKITGEVLVVATMNNDKVFVLRSADEGNSWDKPEDITSAVKEENWKWYAAGPVHAIQLEQLAYKNRLVVPCNHTIAGKDKHYSHAIYSDDNGKNWHLGGAVSGEKTDECTVAELSNGQLMLNMRNGDRRQPNRKISLSNDGGLSWTDPVYDSALIEPMCQGALLRYSFTPNLLLFSNPRHKRKRKNLMLSLSKDNGKTWTSEISICSKKSAYSDLLVLQNGDVLCMYETGKILPYGGIYTAVIAHELLSK